MPNKPKGTVRGHKLTRPQQKLFGMARGMQKGTVSKSASPAAAKIAKSIPASDLHKVAQKPKGGFRK
jgi:hypothetical protein